MSSYTADRIFYIKEGAALPYLVGTLTDATTGEPVPLSGADEVRVKISDDEMQILDETVEIDPDQAGAGVGRVYVDPTLFSARHGRYYAEFDVYWTGARIPQTFPDDGYITIVVVEDLD